MADRSRTTGETVWAYGTSNDPATSNRQTLAWVLWAWRNGATGIVPWQTINADGSALKQADQLGIFIYDKQPDGSIAVRPSLRLKAYLRAQQDIEYLNLVMAKPASPGRRSIASSTVACASTPASTRPPPKTPAPQNTAISRPTVSGISGNP